MRPFRLLHGQRSLQSPQLDINRFTRSLVRQNHGQHTPGVFGLWITTRNTARRNGARIYQDLRTSRPKQSRLNSTSAKPASNSQPHHQPPNLNPTPHLGSPPPAPSLSERLRKLSREYGWTAFGVYMALSALDFPFCLFAVRMLGTERIGRWEHAVVSGAKERFWKGCATVGFSEPVREEEETQSQEDWHDAWGVEEAEEANKGDKATWTTQIALAYAIHKSFIFLRVPLTAAILPRVVKTLRKWGYNIGRLPKASSSTSSARKAGVSGQK